MNTNTSKHMETVEAAGREYVCEFRSERGAYVAICPHMRPISGAGETIDKARADLRQKIEAWIEFADCRELAE